VQNIIIEPRASLLIGKPLYLRIPVTLKTLQNDASVHNLPRNTPAMPMVASAAKHKLSGFFLPGHFA
jgi:hypothetical protein